MNCKPGDLAIVVKAFFAENVGKICRVISLGGSGWWVVDFQHAVRWVEGGEGPVGLAHDSQLRPLRDSDGEDEILRIAGRPHEVTA